MRKCVKCGQEKELNLFRKSGKYFKHTCLECCNAPFRTGKPNTGRFQKGHKSLFVWPKGKPAWNKGISPTPETRKKLSDAHRGRKDSPETIEKRRLGMLNSKKKFRGGKSRTAKRGREWTSQIKERDGYKCQNCGTSEKLHAHHIISWKEREDLRYELSNGITYCHKCHHSIERTGMPNGTKGRKFTDEHRKKLSLAKQGYIPWNKGNRQKLPIRKICKDCGIEKETSKFTPLNRGRWMSSICKMCRNKRLSEKRKKVSE